MARTATPKQSHATNLTVHVSPLPYLNVRDAPGGGILRVVNDGEVVTVLPSIDGWHELKDGGFVKAEYLV